MPLKLEKAVDALDAVPERYRSFYTQGEDKKFALDAELAEALDTSGLNSALEKERKAKKEAEKALSTWSRFKAPEEVEKQLEDLRKAAAGAGEGKANFDKLKADLESAHARALEGKDGEVKKAHAAVAKHLIDAEATAALTELKGSPALLLPIVRQNVRVVEENGAFVARVLDAEGDPRGDGKGGFLTVKQYVEELRKAPDYARAFEPSGTSGSGKRPGSGAGGTPGDAGKSNVDLINEGLAELR